MPTIAPVGPQTQLTERKLEVIADNKESVERNVVSIPDVKNRLAAVVHVGCWLDEDDFVRLKRTASENKLTLPRPETGPETFCKKVNDLKTEIMTGSGIVATGIPETDKAMHAG